MAVRFTDQQQRAIDMLDKSILVSAAAGSGKTAVLVERIINIILSGEAEVDQMLVVTFTKAAASEMRLKLAKAIKKKMKDDSSSKQLLRNQLDKLYKAYISTFDSFAVRVIKEFFYQIDIEPNFKACDDIESTMMQREAIDDLFDDAFEQDNLIDGCSFREFLRLYSDERSEKKIKEKIVEAYNKLRTMPNYWDWAEDKVEGLKINTSNLQGSNLEVAIMDDIRDSLERANAAAEKVMKLFLRAELTIPYETKIKPELDKVCEAYKLSLSGNLSEELISEISETDWITLSIRDKEYKEIYDGIKDDVKKLREIYKAEFKDLQGKYFAPDFKTRLDEMNETYKYTAYYINLLKEFEKRYDALKSEKNLLDFADMEHYAVQILQDDASSQALKKRFKYIFIDEYQDTNNVQEFIISRVAKPNNVFKVGDVKQSIYRFRQAEPAIFQRVYFDYNREDNKDAETIDLNMNFRSNDKTLKYINAVFEKIMNGYDDNAKLYTGVGIKDEDKFDEKYDFIPEAHVLFKESLGEDDADDIAGDEIESLSIEEAEAEYVAKQVERLIGTEFYDTKEKIVRKVESKDIVILLRAIKLRGDIFARALRAKNIEAHVEESDNYYDTIEIGIALSLFTCIDNMKKDVPLIATLHSEVFGWTAEELSEIRIAYSEQAKYRAPYWEALSWYLENGTNPSIREKAQKTVAKIMEWRTVVNMMPLDEFIWKVLVDSGYYLKAGAMYGGDRRQANLRTLVDRAKSYSENGVASLSSFLNFVEIMKEKDIKSGQVSIVSQDDDVVRITTIHKSKGLEYPFVIVGGLGHSFQGEKRELGLAFDSLHGIALPFVNEDRRYWRSTPMHNAIVSKINYDENQENIRVLYVAMTRARNKLILVGMAPNEDNLFGYRAKPRNFLQMINESIKTPFNEYHFSNLDTRSSVTLDSRIEKVLKTRPSKLSSEAEKIYPEIDKKLGYVYPNKDELSTKAKYSVTALRKEMLASELDKDETFESENEVTNLIKLSEENKKSSFADIGIAYHRVMEFMDFTKVSEDYVKETIFYLKEHDAIAAEVADKLEVSKILGFFSSDLGKRAVAAAELGKIQKEKPFTLQTEWQGKDVLVQGIIDCAFEEEGKMVIIDYKFGKVREEYKKQLELYSEAASEGTGKPVAETYLYLFTTGEIIPCI